MSPNTARKLPPNEPPPTLCSPGTVDACMRRMGRIEQSIRELTEAVQRNTESTNRRNLALANLEKRLVLGDKGVK